MIERGYFGQAFRIVVSDFPTYVFGGLILQIVSALALGLFVGPAIGGIVWVTLRHLRGEDVTVQDLFRGFERPGACILAGLVFVLAAGVGLAALVVPGLVAGGLLCFTFPFLVDRQLSLRDALAASRALPAAGDLLDRSLFFLGVLLVGLSGVVLCVVGLLFTWPLMWAVVAVAYEDMTSPRPRPRERSA